MELKIWLHKKDLYLILFNGRKTHLKLPLKPYNGIRYAKARLGRSSDDILNDCKNPNLTIDLDYVSRKTIYAAHPKWYNGTKYYELYEPAIVLYSSVYKEGVVLIEPEAKYFKLAYDKTTRSYSTIVRWTMDIL